MLLLRRAPCAIWSNPRASGTVALIEGYDAGELAAPPDDVTAQAGSVAPGRTVCIGMESGIIDAGYNKSGSRAAALQNASRIRTRCERAQAFGVRQPCRRFSSSRAERRTSLWFGNHTS